jgi:16S rRNA (cytidine1402-2'-O)-methyltransferase
MPGTLYVVATPIGNLEDVTLRALRVLREVSLIAAEDTRRTSRLLQQYSISTPTTSLHEHNERSRSAGLVRRLLDGQSIALVCDAGTPAISDPGARLVAAAHEAGIKVEPVPGANAAIAAASVAGFTAEKVLFAGFPPSRSTDRNKWLRSLADEPHVLVLYEAPHRIKATLTAILEILGDREAVLCRELTKVHETVVKQPISSLLSSNIPERGEFTLVIAPPTGTAGTHPTLPSDVDLATEFGRKTVNAELDRRGVLRELAVKYGVSPKTLYRSIERARKLG